MNTHTTDVPLVVAEIPLRRYSVDHDGELQQSGPVTAVKAEPKDRAFIARAGGSAMPQGARVVGIVGCDGTLTSAVGDDDVIASAAATLHNDAAKFGITPLERTTSAMRMCLMPETDRTTRHEAISVVLTASTRHVLHAAEALREAYPAARALSKLVTGPDKLAQVAPFLDATEGSRVLRIVVIKCFHDARNPAWREVADELIAQLRQRSAKQN